MAQDSTSRGEAGTLERGHPVTAAQLSWWADWIRPHTVQLIEQAGLGHYSSTFSCAEIDEAAIVDTAGRTGAIVTIEDQTEIGGLASLVAEVTGRRLGACLRSVGLPDTDLEVGVPADLYEYYGLTVPAVVAAARDLARP